jgi:hypothetical protein
VYSSQICLPSEKVVGNYLLMAQKLGQGTNAVIYKCRGLKDNQTYALKQIEVADFFEN